MSHFSEVKPALDRNDISFRATSPQLSFIYLNLSLTVQVCRWVCVSVCVRESERETLFSQDPSFLLPSGNSVCVYMYVFPVCLSSLSVGIRWYFVKSQQKWKGLILKTLYEPTHPNSWLSGSHTHTHTQSRKGQSDLLAANGPHLLKQQPHRWRLMDNFSSACSFLCLPAWAWILGSEQPRAKERDGLC